MVFSTVLTGVGVVVLMSERGTQTAPKGALLHKCYERNMYLLYVSLAFYTLK